MERKRTFTLKSLDEISNMAEASEEQMQEYKKASAGKFYYELLNEDEKNVYAQIYYIIDRFEEDFSISSLDEEEIDKIYTYVLNDHPEMFYTTGYTFKTYLLNDKPIKLSFSGTYTMNKEKAASYEEQINAYVVTFLNELHKAHPGSVSDYDAIKFTYEYIIENTDYVKNSDNDQNIISVMLNHKSVCQGYTKTMQYLLNRIGIEATMVIGKTDDGENHAWNLVCADGDYYYVDTTWGDASYNTRKSELYDSAPTEDSFSSVNYDYLLVRDADIADTHTCDYKEILPVCDAVKDNYYMKEGLLFDSVNKTKLRKVFEDAYNAGASTVMLKMTDDDAYDKMWEYLLDRQRVFDFLHDVQTIVYNENRQKRYLIFWI